MKQRFLPGVGAALLALLWTLAPIGAAAQSAKSTAKEPARSSAPASSAVSKTPWGDPDLQGIWLNATITPLERPAGLADKPFLTEAEAAAFEKRTLQQREENERAPRPGEVGAYNNAWFDQGTKVVSTRQTSLVVDPPDGRVPVRPEAEKIRDDNLARNGDSYEYMSVWDRCISRGMPGAMFPAGYNNAYQILQSPGYVVIVHEMIHEVRIIPLDRRPHLPSDIKLWMGDSRGHWEGTTLVVETTNFGKKGWIATSGASGRIKGIPQSETLRVVERFTRAGSGHDSVRSHRRGSRHVLPAMESGDAAQSRSGVPDVRIRVPRRQPRDGEHPERRTGADAGCRHNFQAEVRLASK